MMMDKSQGWIVLPSCKVYNVYVRNKWVSRASRRVKPRCNHTCAYMLMTPTHDETYTIYCTNC